MSTIGLPLEVIRAILREACRVPEAFDYDFIEPELHEMRVARQIKDSMITKLALSHVSKLFQQLTEEYLYEIIHVRSFHHIRPLVNVLRLQNPMTAVTNGWWCRRLEVDHMIEYQWSWGCISLWGLISTCPRLIDLRCSLTFGPSYIPGHRHTYPVSLPLAQTLATQYGSSLRHLQLGKDVTISVRLALRLLPHLIALEVCRFSRFQPVTDAEIDAGLHLSDTEEKLTGSLAQKDGDEDGWPEDEGVEIPRLPGPCQDEQEYEEYLDVVRNACWPSVSDRAVDLPHLRDLRLTPFLSLVEDWKLPSLRSVTDSFYYLAWQDHDHVQALHNGLQPHSESITHFTFQGSGVRAMWEVVSELPFLQHLRFSTNHGFSEGRLIEPHLCLRAITLFRGLPEPTAIADAMDNILMHVEEDKLPRLTDLKVWGESEGIDCVESRRTRCELRHLTLEVNDIKWSIWSA